MSEKKSFTISAYRARTGAKASPALLELRRKQLEIKKSITRSLTAGPKTIPEVAKETGLATRTVLWYVMTYYKYGLVAPAGKTEDGYFRYAIKGGGK